MSEDERRDQGIQKVNSLPAGCPDQISGKIAKPLNNGFSSLNLRWNEW